MTTTDHTTPTLPAYRDLSPSKVKEVFEVLAAEIAHIATHKGFWPEHKHPDELAEEYVGTLEPTVFDQEDLLEFSEGLIKKARETMPRNEAEMIALEHSELSEALEAVRHGNPPSLKIPGFTQVEEELADCVIRLLDHCHGKGYRLAEAVTAKIEHNRTRPFKHGKAL